MKKVFAAVIFFLIIFSIAKYFPYKPRPLEKTAEKSNINTRTMKIVSSAFENNQPIPTRYTCDGDNINPPLQFKDIPGNTKSLVLIMDDPDAPVGTFVHWVVYNIPPTTTEVQENSDITNGINGTNSTGRTNFIGACPPNGQHRYFFKLYALDAVLDLETGATKNQVENAMKEHILSSSELVGLYKR